MEHLQTIELTTDNFEQTILTAAHPAVVDFWAPWCAPCRLMAPVVDALADIFAGRLTVGKVDVDRNAGLAARYGVTSIPTLKLFVGEEVVKTWVGVHHQAQLVRELAKALQNQPSSL